MNHEPWQSIFDFNKINEHNFDISPYIITAQQIKDATVSFDSINPRRISKLCKQETREARPNIFVEKGLFILPVKNGTYAIIKGEGYVDIPEISQVAGVYKSKLDFHLDTSQVGNSEMQHLDFAYASSLIRTFLNDESLVLTIRGRKYTPEFDFYVGKHLITTKSVQTEIDAGYEGREQVALIEAKNTISKNVIIRQLYYPFRQWQNYTQKNVNTIFFEKQRNYYLLYHFIFNKIDDYNSIELKSACKYEII